MSDQSQTRFELEDFQEFLPGPLSLKLAPPQICVISGDSGSGKTRLMRALADLDANEAKVSLNGRERESFTPSEWRKQVAYIAAETAWWSDIVEDHFYADCPQSWLDLLNLPAEVMQWEVSRLSSGERQRLGLLRALVLYPQVLLLDEPTANLDDGNTSRMEALVCIYLGRQSAVALWVCHDEAQKKRLGKYSVYLGKDGVEVRK